MGTKAEQSQTRTQERRRRRRARAGWRRRDRALAPVVVAQRLGIPVADLARAMRAAGVQQQLTEAQAKDWIAGPETSPEWFTTLLGERLARAAEQEFRRQRAEEQRQLRELAVEQSALAKVKAGKKRFNDDEWLYVQDRAFRAAEDLARGGAEGEVGDFGRQVLRAVGVDADDHPAWPVHADGCDGNGDVRCRCGWSRCAQSGGRPC